MRSKLHIQLEQPPIYFRSVTSNLRPGEAERGDQEKVKEETRRR
jgi:hypothetical protein